MKTITQRLHVTGTLWQGCMVTAEYKLHVIGRPDLEGKVPRNRAEVKAIAGDFQDIQHAELVTTTTTTKESYQEIPLK